MCRGCARPSPAAAGDDAAAVVPEAACSPPLYAVAPRDGARSGVHAAPADTSWTLEPRRSASTRARGRARQRRRSASTSLVDGGRRARVSWTRAAAAAGRRERKPRGRRARASWTRDSGGGSACTEVVDAGAAEVGVHAPWTRAAAAAEPRSACTSLVDARQRRRVGVHGSRGRQSRGGRRHASPVGARGNGGGSACTEVVDVGAAVGVHEPRGRAAAAAGRRACEPRGRWSRGGRRAREPRGRAR